jgi:hypothetical protein
MATNNSINTPLIIPVTRGGSGVAAITANSFIYGAGTAAVVELAAGAGDLVIGTAGAPTVVNLADNEVVIGGGTSAPTSIALTDGQLVMGATGAAPAAGNIVGGVGITVTNGVNSISISADASENWTDVTGTSQAMAVNSSYTANNASLVTLTLPAVAAYGVLFEVAYKGAGGWLIAQNASQSIRFGSSVTTSGVGGSLASSAAGDVVRILCTTANTGFEVLSAQGNLTVV